jgi:hypothetical protein
MSMTICVLSDSRLLSTAEWQRAIDNKGFPLRLTDDAPLAGFGGENVAAVLDDEKLEVECSVVDFNELKETYPDVSFSHDWTYVLAFTWSVNLIRARAIWMAAAAYAHATSGVIFDEQEGRLLTSSEALDVVRDIERSLPEIEAALQEFAQQRSAKS